jgi:hypothetical protein
MILHGLFDFNVQTELTDFDALNKRGPPSQAVGDLRGP